jgi:magnesium-transporting ATPase (P-type)
MKEIGMTVLFFGMISLPFYALVLMFFKQHPATLRTSWFIVSAFMQLTLTFSLRTKKFFLAAKAPSFTLAALSVVAAIVVIGLPYTTFGKKVFFFEPPTFHDLLIIFLLILAYFATTEVVKIFYYRTRKN